MIQRVFTNILEISLTTSGVIILVCLLSPILDTKYTAKWKYYIWLSVVLRLLVPFSLTIPDTPIQIDTLQVFQESTNEKAPFISEITIHSKNQTPKERPTNSISNISLMQIFTIIWLIGLCSLVVSHLFQYIFYLKNIKRWFLSPSSEQELLFTNLKTNLGIRRKVDLYRCNKIDGPMLFGFLHPTVLIPCTEYSQTDLYLILKHELTHCKRYDIGVKFILFLVQTLYWFNPFVHLMSKKFNETIEMSCDEYVLSGNDVVYKKRYMETILQSIKQEDITTRTFTTNYNGGIKVMKRRFQNIVDNDRKKKGFVALTVFIVTFLGVSSIVAYSSNGSVSKNEVLAKNPPNIETGIGKADEKLKVEKQKPSDFAKNITGTYAESIPNAQLEKTIIDYLNIPSEYLSQTRYYYNYVDLNNDGKDEIFVVLMGPYTSGSGGSTALFIVQTNSGMHVNQKFTLIQTPIIISDKVTTGCKEIIVRNSGGGASGNYVVLTCSDGQYKTVNEGTTISGLEGVSGTAIICNDIVKDMQEGKSLYLSKE